MLAELLQAPDEQDPVTLQILEAALAEFTEFGMRRVSIADVARRAGLHKATVHRRFPKKDDLVVAASIAWASRFFGEVVAAVSELESFEDRLVEGFTISLQRMRTDPLISRLLVTDSESLLPFVTTQGGPVLAAVTDFFVEQRRGGASEDAGIRVAAEIAARIGLSLVLTPQSNAALSDAEEIRAFARKYLVALL